MNSRSSASPLCGVRGCNTPSRYQCPRCALHYCTSSCYLAHSQHCVNSFTNTIPEPWKRRKVSDYERRRFSNIAHRICHAGFATGDGYEDGILENLDAPEEKGQDEQDAPVIADQVEEHVDSDASAEDEEDAVLLQRFMDEVGHEEKQLLFGLIHQDMRDQLKHRHAQQRRRPASKSGQKGHRENMSSPSARYVKRKHVTDDAGGERENGTSWETETDALEQLAQEMEVTDLTEEQILGRLPVCLVQEFEQRVHRGDVEQMMALWRPWWIVEDGGGEDDAKADWERTGLPPLPVARDLRVPVELPRRRDCVGLIFNVVEVLVGYCHAMRMCNGEWRVDAVDVGRTIGEVSGVLREDARYEAVGEACRAAVRGVVRRDQSRGAAVEALHDAAGVLAGGGEWVTRGLFECERILEGAGREGGGREGKEMRRWARKVGYFVSWGLGEGRETFVHSARQVLSCAEEESGRCEEVNVAERVMKTVRARRKKPLIEEVRVG
eukprot:GFKZ01003134.1.p1 GENE.GFKZ01003134.1~~GFKZ01003134.1.p1  ORF type:complete len:495 (+),score=84.04 GFKZ01003134.1:59-1543(+)